MRGEFLGAWSEMSREIWVPLTDNEDVPADIFCELYQALAPCLKAPLTPEGLADIVDDPVQAREAFEAIRADDIAGERGIVAFLEAAYEALDDLGGDPLSNRYFNLLASFIEKFNLRYELRRPCTLCPTLPGIFATLIRDLRLVAGQDAHLTAMLLEFDAAVRDLRVDCSDGRIKTCIQKHVNFLEALARSVPGVSGNELASMCDQIGSWPHSAIKASLKNLYGFTSDYPGIRHGGNPDGAKRAIEMRDMIALSILLIGFTPYLSEQLNADAVYRGT